MKFKAKTFTVKNGKEIIVREARIDDSEKLIETAKSYIADSEHILLTFEEFNPTIEQEEKWINSYLDNENNLLLVAVYNEQIIGNIEITASKRAKIIHTGIIGMSIVKDWRGVGVGTALMESLIEWSKNNSTLKKIWLEVFANNESGIALYKKMGFIEEGRQSKFIKTGENEFVDNVIMGLDV